jgi:hypothetical protein
MTSSDRFDQYAQDEPSWTLPPPAYQWIEPTRSRPSRQVAMGVGGFGGVSATAGGDGGRGASDTGGLGIRGKRHGIEQLPEQIACAISTTMDRGTAVPMTTKTCSGRSAQVDSTP